MATPQSTFVLALRHNIWRVTFDGLFFGDYRSERQALEGIAEAQRKLATVARIVHASRERR